MNKRTLIVLGAMGFIPLWLVLTLIFFTVVRSK